jgi:hypothetical protein
MGPSFQKTCAKSAISAISPLLMVSGRCPVVWSFFRLSRLLNQEDTLRAPCSHRDFSSTQAPSRGAGMLRTEVIRTFYCYITVGNHQIRHADKRRCFRWLAADATHALELHSADERIREILRSIDSSSAAGC